MQSPGYRSVDVQRKVCGPIYKLLIKSPVHLLEPAGKRAQGLLDPPQAPVGFSETLHRVGHQARATKGSMFAACSTFVFYPKG